VESAVGQLTGRTDAPLGAHVQPNDLLRLMRQLQVKLAAGLSVEKALSALASETKNRRLRLACRDMREEVLRGRPLAGAMAGQDGIFDACVLRLVEDGEATRNLRRALTASVEYIERTAGLRRSMRDAVAKPLDALLLVLSAVFVAAVVLSFLVKDALPAAAGAHQAALGTVDRVAVRAAELVRALWPAVAVCGAAAFSGARLMPRFRGTRALLDAIGANLPLLGGAYRETTMACFCWTIGILMRAGARLDEAMKVAAVTANQEAMRAAIASTVQAIEGGRPYLEAMAESGLLRRRDVAAISTAERGGDLAMTILTLAGEREREAKDRVSRLRTLAQTCVVLVLGLTIVSVVLTLYVPVFVLR
jgi:type II secretory pathway component PulF